MSKATAIAVANDGTSVSVAFAAVYRRHLPAIVRYLRRRLGDDAADDAAAEVFVRAFRVFEGFEQRDEGELPWLYGFASNVVLEQRRAEGRRLRAMERLVRREPPASERTTDGLDPALVRALRALSAADRETVLLVAWGELSYEETARALGVPVGTVASRISRVRRLLDRDRPPAGGAQRSALTGEAHV